MVPACYPSKISSTTGLREAVVFALSSVSGLVRWSDYIPVKLVASADAALEGRTDAGGFIPMDMLSSNTGLMGWVDYLPVYVDNSATDAWAITATGFIPYAASGGFVSTGPAVSSITSATQTEGTSLVHTVTLASAVTGVPATYTFSISGTASVTSDYTLPPTFSNSVTLLGGILTVPVAVTTFTITVATSQDTVYEGTETYTISVGGMSNTGTISDDESAPTVTSVSSASATEGTDIVHTVTITGTAQTARTYAISLADVTATGGGTDYTSALTSGAFSNGVTISGGNISVPAGITSFTVSVPTTTDGPTESAETYTLTIGGASGTGTINDASTPDFYLNLSNAVNVTLANTQARGSLLVGSGAITPATLSVGTGSVSRISGVAPLAVHFDASATTATGTSYPFHDIEYTWSFGDTGAGDWLYGARANYSLTWSKNMEYGPEACHVFETPGDHTVTLNTRYDSDTGTAQTIVITVDDPDVVFASTTVCISTTSDFTGAPSGTQVANFSGNLNTEIATQIAAGKKRILLHRGQSFNVSGDILLNTAGPGLVGAFGTGARPILTATAQCNVIKFSSYSQTGRSDWRVCDLDIDAGSFSGGVGVYFDGTIDKTLVSRVKVSNAKYGFLSSTGNINPANTIWDQMCFYECEAYNSIGSSSSGANGMLVSAQRLAIMGCNINPGASGEHGIRSSYSNRAVFAHNSIANVVDTKAYLSIRSPLVDGDSLGIFDSVDDAGVVYTEKLCVHDNFCDPTAVAGSISSLGVGPVNQDFGIGRVRNVIIERNYMINGQIGHQGSQTTTRNNLVTLTTQGTPFLNIYMAQQPQVQDVWVYNNSIYSTGTYDVVLTSSIGGTYTGSTMTFKNNVIYAPSGTKPSYSSLFYNPGGITITQSNNTAWASYTSTSPNFTATPPVAPGNWKPTSGYTIAGGTSVPAWSDFFGVTVTGSTPDMGAIQH